MNVHQQILNWYFQSGVDETIGLVPVNRMIPKQEAALLKKEIPSLQETSVPIPHPTTVLPDNLLESAVSLARNANSLEELQKALNAFEGCPLKKTAKNTVFGQGNPHAEVMLIGEAPGADEDRIGLPFVGLSGQLLDKQLNAIGLSRQTNVYISNIIPWRPPGNRSPSDTEISLCLPFIKRHIELVNPKILITLGGIAFTALLGKGETISKARGIWHSYQTEGLVAPIDVLPTFHPAFLLRTPAQKKATWHDFLMVQEKLTNNH